MHLRNLASLVAAGAAAGTPAPGFGTFDIATTSPKAAHPHHEEALVTVEKVTLFTMAGLFVVVSVALILRWQCERKAGHAAASEKTPLGRGPPLYAFASPASAPPRHVHTQRDAVQAP
eukprot:TRINITY_DN11002_c0_g1_i1.p2 TRINITY_DN11002_c0_g1~~TRINITY_DN11002_c0_g1_i1.p2  ORF type:complete len:118 (+),score=22.90 TRINITY_DN11002_c0_g1_i1:46-399(+)